MKNHLKRIRHFFSSSICVLTVLLLITSCYHQKPETHDAMVTYSAKQIDSLSFQAKHHYTNNYNFIVKADSMPLIRQQPEEVSALLPTDTIYVYKHNHLVVADIRTIPSDSIDSVWIQVARDQHTFGWQRESVLLSKVVPDDPISQFISTFSDIHLLISLVIVVLIFTGYVTRKLMRKNAHLVHFRDIDSFYPTLLAIIVASAATFYASIQNFAPDVWRHFYFHPTLNPCSVPPLLSVFLSSVWAMLIVGIAAIDDTFHKLPAGEAVLYICGLIGVCAVDYIIFSILSLYYIGYLLLVAYVYFALYRYATKNRTLFVCGNCGHALRRKGRCPHCGAWNS